MKSLFDYIYYKLTKAYIRLDRAKGTTAVCGLAFMQTFMIIDLLYIPLRLIYPEFVLEPYHKYMKYTSLVILVLLFFINKSYYERKYYDLKERFNGESFRVLKTILVFIIILLPLIIFMISIATLKPL